MVLRTVKRHIVPYGIWKRSWFYKKIKFRAKKSAQDPYCQLIDFKALSQVRNMKVSHIKDLGSDKLSRRT